MSELIMSIVIAVLGAIAALLSVALKKKDSPHVNPPSKGDIHKAKADKEAKRIHEEIQNESKANIVKRFFSAFSHSPYPTSDDTGKDRGDGGTTNSP